jgi:hypothetical protein
MESVINRGIGDLVAKNTEQDSSLADIMQYSTVVDNGSDVYPIDMANRLIKNVKITTADADAKEITVTNAPAGDLEIFLELTYTEAAAITWTMSAGSTLIWLTGAAPTLTATKTYRMTFFRKSGTTVWHGTSIGGW